MNPTTALVWLLVGHLSHCSHQTVLLLPRLPPHSRISHNKPLSTLSPLGAVHERCPKWVPCLNHTRDSALRKNMILLATVEEWQTNQQTTKVTSMSCQEACVSVRGDLLQVGQRSSRLSTNIIQCQQLHSKKKFLCKLIRFKGENMENKSVVESVMIY